MSKKTVVNKMKSVSVKALFSISLLMSLVVLPAHAQDICSSAGKSKMRSVSISDAQISKLCPVAADSGKALIMDYMNETEALLDGKDAVGKLISLLGRFEGIGTDFDGRPYMSVVSEAHIWRVDFDNSWKSRVGDLKNGGQYRFRCQITKISSPKPACSLL